MSLFVLPVTSSDLTTLQQGLTFTTNPAQAVSQAAAINAPGSTVSVFTYAAELINSNISLSQVAMGLFPFMTGVTDTVAHIGVITTQFLPAQVTFAVSKGFNPTVFAAEAYGSALSTNAAFNAAFVTPFAGNPAGFAAAVSAATGVSAVAIQQFVNNWTAFFTANPSALQGRTVAQAAAGAAFGDAFGTALVTPGLISNIATVFSTQPGFPFSPNSVQGIVANALIDNAEGLYVAGVAIGALPQHTLLQGELGGGGPLRLTINVDNLTATAPGAIFNGSPASNPPLGLTNTLNTGDNLQDPFGDGTLNFSTSGAFFGGINPPFAQGVTMNGINNVFITANDFFGGPVGFSGGILGLRNVTVNAGSVTDVQVGEFNIGLLTPLQNITINASVDFQAWIASAAFAGTPGPDTVGLLLGGVNTFVELFGTSGPNFYAQVDIHSQIADNFLTLDTNRGTIATITVDGNQDLDVDGNALDMDSLALFNATAATGDITAFFDGTGDVTVQGGSGNDDFTFGSGNGAVNVSGNAGNDTFTFLTDAFSGPTFGPEDTADGGAGNNRLRIQADQGTLLAAGVGANILNIQTIEHFEVPVGTTGDIDVNMARSGSATILDLAANYNGNNVDVTNLLNADLVRYSGSDLNDLTLLHANVGIGTVNLQLSQSDIGGTLDMNHLITPNALLVNIDSVGNADVNEIEQANLIDANINITGTVDLNIGTDGDNYDFDGGVINASTYTGDLDVEVTGLNQTIITGFGDDRVEVEDSVLGSPALINLSVGGADRVEFEEAFSGNFHPDGGNYHLIQGFTVGAPDAVEIDLDGSVFNFTTTTGNAVLDGDPAVILLYTTGTNINGDAGTDFNFVKCITPVNVSAAQTAQDGFTAAFGGGTIDTSGAADDVMFAYYDATDQQMVLGFDSNSNTFMFGGDPFAVTVLIPMSFADYQAFGVNNLHFVV